MKKYLFIIFLIFFFMSNAQALRPTWEYPEGKCELAAKDFQKVYGGNLVYIIPLSNSGAYEMGDYAGAWMNRVNNTYFDYVNNRTFYSIQDIKNFYLTVAEKKVEVYNLNEGHPPFQLIEHY